MLLAMWSNSVVFLDLSLGSIINLILSPCLVRFSNTPLTEIRNILFFFCAMLRGIDLFF